MEIRYQKGCSILFTKFCKQSPPFVPKVGDELILKNEDFKVDRIIFKPEDDLIIISVRSTWED